MIWLSTTCVTTRLWAVGTLYRFEYERITWSTISSQQALGGVLHASTVNLYDENKERAEPGGGRANIYFTKKPQEGMGNLSITEQHTAI